MKKTAIAMLSAVLAFASCSGYLDMTPTDRVSEKTVWATTESAEYSINYLYTHLWDIATYPTNLGLTEALTDQLKYTSYNYNSMCYIPSEMAYGGSILTASYVDVYMGCWDNMYIAIRRTNEALSFLHQYGAMSDDDKVRLEAELRFLRACFYFELAKRYGDVIIYDEDLAAITKDKALDTEEALWDFIQADLEYAGAKLPMASSAGGRIDSGMAWAMESRAMLYAKRYDAVINAALNVADMGYALEANYADAFTKLTTAGNTEAILQYQFDYSNGITHDFNFYYTPGGDYVVAGAAGGGYGVPTQEMVECYEYADGTGLPDWEPWHSGSAVALDPPYTQLEPRFQATILYNGAQWKGRTIEPYVGGTDGWAQWKAVKEPKGKTVTGYYLRKLVDENYSVEQSGGSQPFTLLRYGEVLLNLAEAYALEASPEEAKANACVKQIRERVGLPYTDKSGKELMAAIRAERKVELAYEGLLYWDLRRWGLASSAYPEGLAGYQQHGFKIEQDGGQFKYTYVSVDEKDRTFDSRLYKFPIPESELNSNNLVNQYTEWQ